MADHPHVSYKVKKQHKRSEPDGNGGFQDMWTVHYQTPSGTDSHVQLPATHYTAPNVHAAITADATEIEKVNSLPESVTGIRPPEVKR